MQHSRNFSKTIGRSRTFATLVGVFLLWSYLLAPAAAQQTSSFTSSGSITIPAIGNAAVYPTQPVSSCVNSACVTVAGMQGAVQDVTLTLNDWNNTSTASSSAYVALLLQSPDGRAFEVVSNACKAAGSSTFTLTDAGLDYADPGLQCFTTGDWKATTNTFAPFALDVFTPGPGTTYQRAEPDSTGTGSSNGNGTFAHVFGGMTSANGTWALYVVSAAGSNPAGTIGSWTLAVTTTGSSLPDLTVGLSHTGDFAQGQLGMTYTAIVNNAGGGEKPAGSLVSLTDTAPPGLVVVAMSGNGWTCTTLPTCTRSDVLAAGNSYAPVTISVNVAADAATPRVNNIAVITAATEFDTGNNSADDSTTIVAGTAGSLAVARSGSGAGTVTSFDGGIACGATCTAPYVNGSGITLTALAGIGSSFTGWLGACTGTGPCVVTISGASAVSATFAGSPFPAQILDIDANGQYGAATDGLLVLRSLFGLRQNALFDNAVGANPGRTQAQITAYLADIRPYLDADGNGIADPLTDGVLILRDLAGLAGTALTQGAVGAGATRSTATQIHDYLNALKP